ncbi:MAG: hypothetical protein INR65_01655, partial [Gluconacetobacter diazotrophicus]|nr:hypothetical protein [Gluconacetobacter diazotrophicus]
MSEAARATRKLAEEFRQASDTKILKITRMIDQMPERGEADALLEPIRDRLASLRPSRRMTWTRLLFLPFDPVLVPASQWRPGQYALPRSALLPVTVLLGWSAERGRGEPPLGEGADDEAMLPVAGPLWDDAAARLAVARPPEAWRDADWQKQTGLTVEAL